MKQSRFMSWVETIGGTALGFVIAIMIQYVVCWWYALPLTALDNLGIIAIFTIASLIRGYGWRRLMEATGVRMKLSPFMQAVIAERARQIDVEGWSHEHDDAHQEGELGKAGAAYVIAAGELDGGERLRIDRIWPWSLDWWKPTGFRRDLVKGCALIVAEGERFDRMRKSQRRTTRSAVTDDRTGERSPIVNQSCLAHNKPVSEQGGSSA